MLSGQRAVKSAFQEYKLLGPLPFCRNEERFIPQFWPILIIIFAFLSLLQQGGMQLHLLHSGNVVWPTSVADYSVGFCGMSPQDWLGLFCPQNSQHRAHGNCSSTVGWTLTFMTYVHSHVKYSIHLQEVQKRGYFILGIACATTKQKN